MEPFDFGRFFRGFLGLDRHRDLREDFSQEDEREEEGDYDQHQSFGEKSPFFTFRVFTDPLGINILMCSKYNYYLVNILFLASNKLIQIDEYSRVSVCRHLNII